MLYIMKGNGTFSLKKVLSLKGNPVANKQTAYERDDMKALANELNRQYILFHSD